MPKRPTLLESDEEGGGWPKGLAAAVVAVEPPPKGLETTAAGVLPKVEVAPAVLKGLAIGANALAPSKAGGGCCGDPKAGVCGACAAEPAIKGCAVAPVPKTEEAAAAAEEEVGAEEVGALLVPNGAAGDPPNREEVATVVEEEGDPKVWVGLPPKVGAGAPGKVGPPAPKAPEDPGDPPKTGFPPNTEGEVPPNTVAAVVAAGCPKMEEDWTDWVELEKGLPAAAAAG